jgi:hypothetical protein
MPPDSYAQGYSQPPRDIQVQRTADADADADADAHAHARAMTMILKRFLAEPVAFSTDFPICFVL